MMNGTITLGQISDKGMQAIIEARDNHPDLILNQSQLSGSGSGTATLSWRDADGLKALAELLQKLATLP
jgi:hypothetical protein